MSIHKTNPKDYRFITNTSVAFASVFESVYWLRIKHLKITMTLVPQIEVKSSCLQDLAYSRHLKHKKQ